MVAVVGIAVGTAALILTLSIVNGFAGSVESKLISFSAHLQIRHPDEPLFQERRTDLSRIGSNPNIANASPFLEKSFVLRSRGTAGAEGWLSKPVVVKGVSTEQQSLFLKKFLKAGSLAESDKGEGIALYAGQTLAENLDLTVGKKVMLVGLGSNATGAKLIASNKNIVDMLSSLNIEVGIIRGIYDTGLQEGFDDFVVIADLKELQQRFNPMMISGYDANVHDLNKLPATVKELVNLLGFPFYGYTVFERYANLFEWLKLQKNIRSLLYKFLVKSGILSVRRARSTVKLETGRRKEYDQGSSKIC